MTGEATNGTLTPPGTTTDSSQASVPNSTAKRKRSDTEHQNDAPAKDLKLLNGGRSDVTQTKIQGTLNVLHGILKGEDSTANVLETPIPSTSKPSSADPATKKAKLSISSKVEFGSYLAYDDFLDDIAAVVSHITEPLLAKEPLVAHGSYARVSALTAQELQQLTQALALQKLATKLILNDQELHQPLTPPAEDNAIKDEKSNSVLEIKLESEDESHRGLHAIGGRNVLTLFGNAQGAKQLFSSLQQASSSMTKVALPIRAELLPNMISTTRILPVKSEDAVAKKAGPTIGEIFKAPASVRDLTPPKSRQSNSRSSTLTWEFPDTKPKRRTSYNYTTTSVVSGQWLGYRGIDVPEPTSPEAKRKQRDRALSSGEAKPLLSEEAREAFEQAKEDALFRSVYSSFAPSRDDSGSVVSSQVKEMVWWQKGGAQKFAETFSPDDSAIEPSLMDLDTIAVEDDLDEEKLKDAVDAFDPQLLEPLTLEPPKKTAAEMDTEEILQEVSDLLQTLDSYQRIRNSSLATAGHTRTPSMSQQRETVTSLSGSPTSPSAGEVEIYNILRSQLTILIKSLPPFAVAKLNGEQLADLNLTKNLLVESKDYKGVMEEDAASRAARQAALNAAVGGSQNNRPSAGVASNLYNTPGYSRPASSQLGTSRPSSYFPQQQPPNNRTPIPRAGGYSTPNNYQNTQPRPNYSQQQAYNAAVSSTRGPGYASTPLSNFNNAQNKSNSYAPNNTQAFNQNRNYHQTPGATYQPRPNSTGPAQQAPMFSSYANQGGLTPNNAVPQGSASPHVRTASPLKPAPARPQYNANSTGSVGTPVSVSYSTPTVNGTALPNRPNGVGPSGYHSSMTGADQASLMDRQRERIREQGKGSASPAPAG